MINNLLLENYPFGKFTVNIKRGLYISPSFLIILKTFFYIPSFLLNKTIWRECKSRKRIINWVKRKIKEYDQLEKFRTPALTQ